MLEEEKILFTGGSGNLGKACKKIFPLAQYPNKIELNILEKESIAKYFSTHKVSSIIHLAALASVTECENNKKKAYALNVDGTKNILEVSKENKVKHFIYLNTACIFRGTDETIMEDEDGTPYPENYYGLTKYLAEEIAKTYNSQTMSVTIVRTNFACMPWKYPGAFIDRYGTYLFAQGVAKGLRDILVEKSKYPVIHLCGDRKMSMYEYALAGNSKVKPITLAEYQGVPLTKNMSLASKYWRLYKLEDSDFNDS